MWTHPVPMKTKGFSQILNPMLEVVSRVRFGVISSLLRPPRAIKDKQNLNRKAQEVSHLVEDDEQRGALIVGGFGATSKVGSLVHP